jgi:hypothetical protein
MSTTPRPWRETPEKDKTRRQTGGISAGRQGENTEDAGGEKIRRVLHALCPGGYPEGAFSLSSLRKSRE